MEFLNPAALYGLFFLPLLLIPYLVRRRPRRVVFSSLLLLRGSFVQAGSRPWGRLRLPLIFFLQLLFLLLLILASARPVFTVRSPQKIALILDNSASMQAREGRESRFEQARAEARRRLMNLPADVSLDLFVTAPIFQPIRTGLRIDGAVREVSRLNPYDLGEPSEDYGEKISQLTADYDGILLLTDRLVHGDHQGIETVRFGQPQENLAITSFSMTRPSLSSSSLRAEVEVTSFANRIMKFKVALRGNGKTLVSRSSSVAPEKKTTIRIEGIPPHPHYEVELESRDAFYLDNRRFAVWHGETRLPAVAITPRPQSLQSLRSIPGLSLGVVSPDDYATSPQTAPRLEIFHLSTPATLPPNPALFVLPPETNPLVSLESPVAYPLISDWSDPHPLTRYVNFSLFRPPYARPLKPLASAPDDPAQPRGGAGSSSRTRWLPLFGPGL